MERIPLVAVWIQSSGTRQSGRIKGVSRLRSRGFVALVLVLKEPLHSATYHTVHTLVHIFEYCACAGSSDWEGALAAYDGMRVQSPIENF